MKLIIFLLLTVTVINCKTYSQIWRETWSDGEWVKKELQCNICGKDIYKYEWDDKRVPYDDMTPHNYPPSDIPESLGVHKVQLVGELGDICLACEIKYGGIVRWCGDIWNKRVREIVDENKCNRINYDRQRKERAKENAKLEIKKLKEQIKKLEGEK